MVSVLKVQKVTPDAPLPTFHPKSHYTLYSNEDITLEPHGQYGINTGIRVAFPLNYCALVVQAGELHVMTGLVDSDYRGELKILVCTETQRVTVRKGDPLAKLFLLEVELPDIRVVSEQPVTLRNEEIK